MFARRVGRDHGLRPAVGEPVAQGPGVIGAIRLEAPRRTTDSEQGSGSVEIVGIAGSEDKGDRAARIAGRRVDFPRSAAARGANGMMTSPPFVPAAVRWALMWVESTEPAKTPVEPVTA